MQDFHEVGAQHEFRAGVENVNGEKKPERATNALHVERK